jgi:dihydrofolate reductase
MAVDWSGVRPLAEGKPTREARYIDKVTPRQEANLIGSICCRREEFGMSKLIVFNSISIDGFFTDKNNDIGWARSDSNDDEWNQFVEGNASGTGTLVFGRITYEMMASYWPTPMAMQRMPVVAGRMNGSQKVVFSRTLKKANWENTRLVKDDLVSEIQMMKNESENGITIMGSGTIVAQIADAGLVDEFQMVLIPVVLGEGRTLFQDVKEKIDLRLTNMRTFRNGNVFLCYAPITK